MFSPDGTLISASAAPHCGADGQTDRDRETEIQRARDKDRQIERGRDRETDRQTESERQK